MTIFFSSAVAGISSTDTTGSPGERCSGRRDGAHLQTPHDKIKTRVASSNPSWLEEERTIQNTNNQTVFISATFVRTPFEIFNVCRGWKDAGGPRFLSSDKERAPCLCVIVSGPKWPLHHPARGGIHLRKIIIEDVNATRLQIWMYSSLISHKEGRLGVGGGLSHLHNTH